MTADAPKLAGRKVITGTLHRERRKRVEFSDRAVRPAIEPPPRPSALSQMVALAHHIQRAIDDGRIPSRAAVAAKLDLTRARVTQLLDLVLLAPDIQEDILNGVLPPGIVGERGLRPIVRHEDWVQQRRAWRPQ